MACVKGRGIQSEKLGQTSDFPCLSHLNGKRREIAKVFLSSSSSLLPLRKGGMGVSIPPQEKELNAIKSREKRKIPWKWKHLGRTAV